MTVDETNAMITKAVRRVGLNRAALVYARAIAAGYAKLHAEREASPSWQDVLRRFGVH